jgi:acyl-CoA thioester hydrolase
MSGQDAAPGADLTRPETFDTWCRVSVRYNDLDPLGHVNNAAMAVFLEQARCELITPRLKAHGRHLDMVLASTKLDYLKELHYPGDVEIGTIATRIGSKSFNLAHGVFQNGICAGTGSVVMVVFDLDKRTSVVPPDDVRALLERLLHKPMAR